jgi:hypothetical protein
MRSSSVSTALGSGSSWEGSGTSFFKLIAVDIFASVNDAAEAFPRRFPSDKANCYQSVAPEPQVDISYCVTVN